MKTILSLLLNFSLIIAVSAQTTVIFEDSFENYEDFAVTDVGDWILIDVDGAATYGFDNQNSFPFAFQAKSFQVFDGSKTAPPLTGQEAINWKARTGSKAMVSFGAVNVPNNDWMISPKITLGISDNVLNFYAKATDPDYIFEEFNVYVSTTTPEIDNFELIGSEIVDLPSEFIEYSYDLSDYNGKQIYFAIQCVSNDQFGFMVDDISITGNVLGVSDSNIREVNRIFPNPVNSVFQLALGSSFDENKLIVEIYDLSGKRIKHFNSSVKEYSVEELLKGVYILKVSDGINHVTKKLIKK